MLFDYSWWYKPVASFWCLYCYLWTYFTPCSSVSIVNFQQVITGWVATMFLIFKFLSNFAPFSSFKNNFPCRLETLMTIIFDVDDGKNEGRTWKINAPYILSSSPKTLLKLYHNIYIPLFCIDLPTKRYRGFWCNRSSPVI